MNKIYLGYSGTPDTTKLMRRIHDLIDHVSDKAVEHYVEAKASPVDGVTLYNGNMEKVITLHSLPDEHAIKYYLNFGT